MGSSAMFFSAKYKAQISDLADQLELVKAEKQTLADEILQLKSELHSKAEMNVQNDSSQQTIISSWIDGAQLVAGVRDTIASEAENLRSETVSMNDSIHIFEESQQAVNVILERVESIQQNSSTCNGKIEDLVSVSQQIEEFVGVIRGISDQTNLLALNAAIEAARAGESGRGFAVVADEVRNLARKANEASESIANLVNRIAIQTKDASEDIGQVQSTSSDVVASAEQIRIGVAQVVDLSERMSEVIGSSSTDSFIQTVKLDHVIWKNMVYTGIVGDDLESMTALADHTSCRLGNWYYMGQGKQEYSHLPSFHQLEAPHECVHKSGVAAVECARTGDMDGAAHHLAEMEQASGLVEGLLTQLNSEIP